MNEERITLTQREQQRALVLTRVVAGHWTQREAAAVLGLSERQVRRRVATYQVRGPAGLMHGNRGRPPVHTLPTTVREQVVALARGKYAGFNDQHLTEKLAEAEQLVLGRATVRRILRDASVPSPRKRRAPKHRQRRERMSQAGMLLQADGSRHRWLGPDGRYVTLIGGIDDATSTVPHALFREQEDAHGYLLWLERVVQTLGIPQALYVDRHSIHQRHPTDPLVLMSDLGALEGDRLTQFGRAAAELGIRLIHARSPQAKGRIERLWGTFQDRLGSELRLAGATTLAAAQQVLEAFLPAFNARFAVPPAEPGSAYRPLPAGVVLAEVLCFKYLRVVAADNTVQLGEHHLQIQPSTARTSYARLSVDLHERLDGSAAVYYQGQCLATQPAPPSAPQLRARKADRPPPVPVVPAPPAAGPILTDNRAGGAGTMPARPAASHPWKRFPAVVQRTKSRSS